MRLALILATTALCGGLTAQQLLLVERVPSPLVYVAVVAGSETGAPGLETLLDDPTVRHLMSADGERADPGSAEPVGASSLAVLDGFRGLLALSTGELELVLTGLLPRADAPALPLLLSRVRLSDDGCERLQQALSNPAVAAPSREVAGRQTFELKSVSQRRPGSRFEIALIGHDLLVSNHMATFEAVLGSLPAAGQPGGAAPATPAVSAPLADSLAADQAFGALRDRLAGGPGSALVVLDWRRLRDRARHAFGPDRELLLQSVGLMSADRVAVGLRALDGALFTTILVDQPDGADGLLAVARPTPVRKLAQELPGRGIAAVAFSVEPNRLHELAHRHGGGPVGSFHGQLVGGCRRFGVEFDEQIAVRLGDTGTCRLVLLGDGAVAADRGARSAVAVSFRARSTRAARGVFDDIKAAVSERQIGAQTTGRGDREVLVFPGGAGRGAFGSADGASLGVVGDSLVLGLHSEAVDRLAELDRSFSRADRSRTLAATQRLLDRLVAVRDLDARTAIGVVEVDGSVFTAAASDRSRRHAGVILLDADGTTPPSMRIELISPI